MTTALAAQLAQSASKNAELLIARSKNVFPATESYLFSSKDARQHDLDSVLALAQNGVAQLELLSPDIFGNSTWLFEPHSRDYDRTSIPIKEVERLNAAIKDALSALSPFLMEAAASKIMEWLVRRFRVHEFNQEELLACFLPYHESTAFIKLMTLIRVNPNSKWGFLTPSKVAPKPLLRAALVVEMCKDLDLSRFIASLLTSALDKGRVHRSLVAFSTGTLAEYISRLKKIDEGVLAILLPSCIRMVEGIDDPLQKDVILAGAILLSALSHRCALTVSALHSVCACVLNKQSIIGDTRALQTVVAVLGPQDEMSTLDFQRIADQILALPNVLPLFQACVFWANPEKFLSPLSSWLQNRLDVVDGQFILTVIVNTQECPPAVLLRVCLASFTRIINEGLGDEGRDASFQAFDFDVLKAIYQRHYSLFEQASRSVQSSLGEEKKRIVYEKLLMCIALNRPSISVIDVDDTQPMDIQNAPFAIRSADISLRASGVRYLVEHLAKIPADAAHVPSNQSIVEDLTERMVDLSESKEVLEALYQTSPQTLLRFVIPTATTTTPSDTFDLSGPLAVLVQKLSLILLSADLSPEISQLHVEFVLLQLIPDLMRSKTQNDMWMVYIVDQLILPLLLFTKRRQKRSLATWRVIFSAVDTHTYLNEFDVLKGCKSVLEQEVQLAPDITSVEVAKMETINARLIGCLTENLIASSHFDQHVHYLLNALKESDPFARLLPQLLLGSVIPRLSGARQFQAASRALGALLSRETIQAICDSLRLEAPAYKESLSMMELLKNVVLKPGSQTTTARLDASVINEILGTNPPKVIIDYLTNTVNDNTGIDSEGPAFVHLARSLYRAANFGSTLNSFALHVLSELFSTLQEDALLLLAGLWSIEPNSDAGNLSHTMTSGPDLQLVALSHAKAYLRAHSRTPGKLNDFQTILPSLILPLRSLDQRVRVAAIECAREMYYPPAALESGANADIFAYDRVYGTHSGKVQYLDFLEYQKHVQLLCERAEYFYTDPDYISSFHREFIHKVKGEGKKETSRKQRVLCYLLSHALSWGSLFPQLMIMQSLANVHDPAKLPTIFPLLESVASAHTVSLELFACLFSMFDKPGVVHLHNTSLPYWATFVGIIRNVVKKMPSLVPVLAEQIRTVFPLLSVQRRVELASLIVTLAPVSTESDVYVELKALLASTLNDTETVIKLLQAFQISIRDAASRAPKKPRVEGNSEDRDSDSLQSIIFLMEAISSARYRGTLELVRTLLETLDRLCQNHAPSRSDYDYVEQLVVATLDHASSSIESSAMPNSLPINVLVKLVQVSENPQTFQHALLVLSKLAKISPDSIIHAIMPIFTFMGVNLFPRDDSYTFNVVLQTINNIVPLMVGHLRSKPKTTLEIQMGARESLRVFTRASTHLPKHRRNKFFTQLIDCLGPHEFTSPICMLLIEKSASKVIHGRGRDTNADLALALSVAKQARYQDHLTLLRETLAECCRLANHVSSSIGSSEATFLEASSNSSHAVTIKQIHALIIFVELAWTNAKYKVKPISDEAVENAGISEVVSGLITLMTISADPALPITLADVNAAAGQTLVSGLKVTTVAVFVNSIEPLLRNEKDEVQNAAASLLSSRVGTITKETRESLSSQFTVISKNLTAIIASSSSTTLLSSSLSALELIMRTSTSHEAQWLVPAVRALLRCGQRTTLLPEVLQTLATACTTLGPWLLDQMSEIIALCLSSLAGKAEQQAPALQVLSSLVKSMKLFWGNELGNVIRKTLTIKHDATMKIHRQLTDFEELVATTLAPGTVIHALIKVWDETLEIELVDEFFNILNKTIQSAPRTDVLKHARPLFELFVNAFTNIARAHAEAMTVNDKESAVISAFVMFVTKLSEASFTPLFRQLQDWAWSGISTQEADPRRKATFCRVMIQLVTTFKSLMSCYMISVVPNITETLEAYSSHSLNDSVLWSDLIRLLTTSVSADKSNPILRDNQLSKLITPLAQQISVWPVLPPSGREDLLPLCTSRIFGALSRDEYIKKLNTEVLMQTRSEDAKVRLLALRTAIQSWTEEGAALSGFAMDMIAFIHECSEDENDEVAKAARSLKRIVTETSGSLADM